MVCANRMFKNVANWRLELRSISRNVFPLQKLSLKELLMEKKKNSAKHGVHRFRQAAMVVLATCR